MTKHLSTHILLPGGLYSCVCARARVCVCVCVREREREICILSFSDVISHQKKLETLIFRMKPLDF